MYLILNKTTRTITKTEGNYPLNLINSLLNDDQDIIIVSLYSNTIKVPFSYDGYGNKEWDSKEYAFPPELVNPEFMLKHSKETREFALDTLNNKLRANQISTEDYITERAKLESH